MKTENDTKLLYALYSWMVFIISLPILMLLGFISEWTACGLLILSATILIIWGLNLMSEKRIKVAIIVDGDNTFYTDNLKHPKAKGAEIVTMFKDDYKRIPSTIDAYDFNK